MTGAHDAADRRQRLGAAGEERAAAWYVEHGYEVLARNWRTRTGELDLVCARDRLLVVCEVKSRRSHAFGAPFEAVTAAKQHRVRRLAAGWLAEHPHGWFEVRFDVVGVDGSGVHVIEGAF